MKEAVLNVAIVPNSERLSFRSGHFALASLRLDAIGRLGAHSEKQTEHAPRGRREQPDGQMDETVFAKLNLAVRS